jgi:hypothetical protein
VSFLRSGMGAIKSGAYALYGMITEGRYFGGAEGAGLAETGVPGKSNVESVNATAACFIYLTF